MKDYTRIRAKAKSLVEKYGRLVNFYRLEAGDPADAQPWKRNLSTKVEFSRVGVFVPPGAVRIFGLTALGDASMTEGVLERVAQICIFAPDGLDVKSITHAEDRGETFGVLATQTLRPGEIDLLAFLWLER
jgi:hypothetical protein